MMESEYHFNSQPHEEADRSNSAKSRKHYYFNSQPHEEADVSCLHEESEDEISTHSLTKRLTVDGRLKDDNLKTFQLTASRRG